MLTRTRKFALESSAAVQLRPHVLVAPPRVRAVMLVVNVGVACAAVHETPPSQESATHIRGEPDVLSTRASRRTSMPLTAAPAGTVIP